MRVSKSFFIGSFIAFFMAMLFLPLIFVDLSSDRVSVQENRMLANRPALRDIKAHPKTFVREFDEWFRDSVGFREQALALYKALASGRNEHRIIVNHFYLAGRQGHRYTITIDNLFVFQGKPIFSDEQLRNLAEKLDEVKEYLDKKNIPFIVMFGTAKESIYPEYFPEAIKRGPEPIQLDAVTKYLRDHTGVDVFNIRQALLSEKEKYPLYPIQSSSGNELAELLHYNQIGAFFAYRELVRHIQAYFPGFVPYGVDDVVISCDADGIADVSLKQEASYKVLPPSFFDGVPVAKPLTGADQAFENNNADLPTILLLCDSYTGFITKYIAQQFGKTITIHWANMKHLEEYITKYNPDIVVFESTEWYLKTFANSILQLKTHDLL